MAWTISVAVQDKKFSPTGQFISAPTAISILVNGTPHPYLVMPGTGGASADSERIHRTLLSVRLRGRHSVPCDRQ
ncbi:MAG: hypothetical protein IPJ10_17365 [Flavobacteriales bacterium]|nr:hypothetical protein [Flavobacteriales bacterium]